MKRKKPTIRTVAEFRRSEATEGWRQKANAMTAALYDITCALGSPYLSFDERRTVLMWAAEAHDIDPGKLQGRQDPR